MGYFHRGKFLKVLLLLFLLLFNLPAFANELPLELQVSLSYKVLSFEKRITTSAEQDIKLAIIFDASDEMSVEAKDMLIGLYAKNAGRKIKGKNLIVQELEVGQDISGFDIVYFTNASYSDLEKVLNDCYDKGILTLSGNMDYAERGVALTFCNIEKKPTFLINKNSVKSTGASFHAALLSLAKLI